MWSFEDAIKVAEEECKCVARKILDEKFICEFQLHLLLFILQLSNLTMNIILNMRF